MKKRDCSTCLFDRGEECVAPGTWGCFAGTLDLYRPRPYWTASERAGIKAMGKHFHEAAGVDAYPGELSGVAMTTIRAYVKAARAAKGRT